MDFTAVSVRNGVLSNVNPPSKVSFKDYIIFIVNRCSLVYIHNIRLPDFFNSLPVV